MNNIQHKETHALPADAMGNKMGFEDGRPVPLYSPTLPLEHQLLETLRNLDLDNDRAQAIREIERAFDKAEIRKLAQVWDWFRERLGDGSAAWLAMKRLMDSPLSKPTQEEKVSRWVNTIKERVKTKDK